MSHGSIGDVKEADHRTWNQGILRSKPHFTWLHSSPGRVHRNNSSLFTSIALARKVVRTHRCHMCFERISSCTDDFLKKRRHHYSCITPGLCNSNLMVKLEKGATSKYVFTETIWGVHSECCSVAELSTALPPQVLLSQGQIPFWLTAENRWHCPTRSRAQTMSFRRVVVACWRRDSAM